VFLGGSAITVMPEDIFPEINIPVVSVIWQYTECRSPIIENPGVMTGIGGAHPPRA
jgi:hypothetical protein